MKSLLCIIFSLPIIAVLTNTNRSELIPESPYPNVPSQNQGVTLLAKVGVNDPARAREGRVSFSNKMEIKKIYGEAVDEVRENTFFTDCTTDGYNSTGFLVDLNSEYFSSIPKIEEYRKTCTSRIFMSNAHVLRNFYPRPISQMSERIADIYKRRGIPAPKGSKMCKVFNANGLQSKPVHDANSVYINEDYEYAEKHYEDIMGNDFGFLAIHEPATNYPSGFKICNEKEFRATSSCAIPQHKRSLGVSQSYKAGKSLLYSSDSTCCVDYSSSFSDRFAHKCHIWDGASGGPLLNISNSSEVCVAGINVGLGGGGNYNLAVNIYQDGFLKKFENFLEKNCN